MVVDRLRWLLRLLLFAVAVGAVLFYSSWSQATRIRDVKVNGIEGIATIDAVKRTTRGTSVSYSLKLVWRHANGAPQTDYVPISNTFAQEIIRGDLTVKQGSVRIKYLREAASESAPIVLDDADHKLEENDLWVWLGGGLVGVGAIGSGLLLLLGRRWRREQTTA